MTLNQAYAKIYDTIYFHLMYFNGEELRDRISCYDDGQLNGFKLFSEIAPGLMPPRILYPFFKYNNKKPCILSKFFNSGFIDIPNDTIDSFLEKLHAKSDYLYEMALNETFSDYEKTSGKKVMPSASPSHFITAIDNLEGSTEYKLQTALLFSNFTYAVDLLIESMKKVYAKVETLHEKHADEIEKAASEIENENYIQFYVDKYHPGLDKVDNNAVVISIALLNQFFIYGPIRRDDIVFTMLGINHKKCYIETLNVGFSPAADFIIACGSVLRMKMLEGLAEKKEMTLSEFARYADSQPTTMIRNLQMLKNNNIIVISRHEAQQIFYKVNTEYLMKVRTSFNELIDKLIE